VNFVLVHGAFHGSWCWDLLIPELEALGHRTIAVDLPTGEAGAGARRCAEVIVDTARGLDEIVLLGHSMAGLSVPLAAQDLPVRKLVFLCALVPRPGHSMAAIRASEPVDNHHPIEDPEWIRMGSGIWMVGARTARGLFYDDVPEDIAEWAIGNLRPQNYQMMNEKTPIVTWPNVDSASIVCDADLAINPQWSRWVASKYLGVEPIEMRGGHSPFLTQPERLARILSDVV
jgi:pimeloyl-ACP methyl ester carboxylesterase